MYKSLSKRLIISSLMLSLSLYLMACTGGTGIRNLPPIFPPTPDEELAPDVTVYNLDPETVIDLKPKDDPKHGMITISKEDVVVTAQYWRGYDLDSQFNRGNMKSPFYYEGAWHQSEKVDVFWVTITNNRENPIVFNVKKCEIIDNREDEYQALSYDENVKRLLYKKGRTKDTDIGLKKSKEILLEMQAPTGEIQPGKKIEGYIPFYQLKRLAEGLTVTIPIELAPPKGTIERYKTVKFNLAFAHSPTIRDAQPATIRF